MCDDVSLIKVNWDLIGVFKFDPFPGPSFLPIFTQPFSSCGGVVWEQEYHVLFVWKLVCMFVWGGGRDLGGVRMHSIVVKCKHDCCIDFI